MNRAFDLLQKNGIFIGLLALVLGVPTICSPYTQTNVFLIKTVFFQSLTFALFIFWLTKKFLSREPFSPLPLMTPMILFLGVGILSFTFSPYKYAVLEEFLRFLSFFLLYLLVVAEIRADQRKMLILDSLVFVTIVVCLYGILQRLGYPLFGWMPKNLERVMSFFGNPIFFATYLVAILPLLLVLGMGSTKKRKFFAGIAAVLSMACLIFTGTRSAWIGFALSVLLLAVLIHRTKVAIRKSVPLLSLLVIFGTMFLLLIYNHHMIIGRISEIGDPYGSASARMHIWKVTLDMIKASPILGSGLGTFQIVFPQFKYPNFNRDVPIGNLSHAHNEYLEITAEMGLVGLAVFWWLLGSFFRQVFRYLKNKKEEGLLVIGLVCGIAGVLMDALFSPSLRWTAPPFTFWLLFGLTMAMIAPKELPLRKEDQKTQGVLTHLVVISVSLLGLGLITGWHIERYKPNIYVGKAQAFLDSDLKDQAMLELKKALDYDSQCPIALYLLGCLNVEKGAFSEAKSWFVKLEKLARDFANIHEWKGYLLFQQGELPMAETEFKFCTQVKSSVFNRNMLGRVYSLQKKWDLAIEEFEQAYRLGKTTLKSRADTGDLIFTEGNIMPSLETVAIPGEKRSTSFEEEEMTNTQIMLAQVYYEKKEYEKSIQQTKEVAGRILSEKQVNIIAQLYNRLAWDYAKEGKNLDQALELCQSGLSLNCSNPETIHDTEAWVYFKKGNLKEAKKEMEKALKITPDNAIIQQHLWLMERAIREKVKNIDLQEIR